MRPSGSYRARVSYRAWPFHHMRRTRHWTGDRQAKYHGRTRIIPGLAVCLCINLWFPVPSSLWHFLCDHVFRVSDSREWPLLALEMCFAKALESICSGFRAEPPSTDNTEAQRNLMSGESLGDPSGTYILLKPGGKKRKTPRVGRETVTHGVLMFISVFNYCCSPHYWDFIKSYLEFVRGPIHWLGHSQGSSVVAPRSAFDSHQRASSRSARGTVEIIACGGGWSSGDDEQA
ncbi:hypothetical protein H4582DRAFT_12837 [Lactarius indigo]|nr:hypothetical protein H4582DRAFT_12837 [Lactarius indigo]